jgi:hypothetical protein
MNVQLIEFPNGGTYKGILIADAIHGNKFGSSLHESSPEEGLFVTLPLLLVLDPSSQEEPKWAESRVTTFVDRLLSVLNRLTRSLVVPVLQSFEVLLKDFRQVLGGVRDTFAFPQAVNGYLGNHLFIMLDAKLLNKVIASPSRSTFMNVVVWNTFTTAVGSVEKLDFRMLTETVWLMAMGRKVSDPQTMDGIAKLFCRALSYP